MKSSEPSKNTTSSPTSGEIPGLDVRWAGQSANWLGDKRWQVIFQVTPRMGVSVLGPQHRVDASYGLPDVKEKGFDGGIKFITDQFRDPNNTEANLKVAVIVFLNDDEYPLLPPGKNTGLRFKPVGYMGVDDPYRDYTANEVLRLMANIAKHDEKGIEENSDLEYDFNRQIRFHHFMKTCVEDGVKVYLDPTHPCVADPHPVSKPYNYAYTNLNGRLPEEGKLVGVYVWTNSQYHCFQKAIKQDGDKFTIYIGSMVDTANPLPVNTEEEVDSVAAKYQLTKHFKQFIQEQIWPLRKQ